MSPEELRELKEEFDTPVPSSGDGAGDSYVPEGVAYIMEVSHAVKRDAVRVPGIDKWEPAKLRTEHWNMIRMAVLGMPQIEIAERTGYTEVQVGNVLRSALAREAIAIMQARLNAKVEDVTQSMAEDAAAIYEKTRGLFFAGMMEDKERANLGLKLLDRAGFSPVKKIMDIPHGMSPEEMEQIRQRAAAGGMKVHRETEEAQIIEETDRDNNQTA